MTPFDEVIFLADKLEPSRDYRRIRDLRELAFRDLDRATIAVLRTLSNTLKIRECAFIRKRKLPLQRSKNG